MNELVFLEPNKIDAVPFTTSDVIAEYADINYRSVQRRIEKHESSLSLFGRVRFEITPFETKGGMQSKKIWYLNEEQATLLVTFLKNTPTVVAFKIELVRQFYAMRTELNRRHAERIQLKPIRREMTDAISRADPDKWAYKRFTDLSYLMALGKTARKLREERGAPPKAKAVDYLTADEIHDVTEMQYRIGVLVEIGMCYQQIKDALAQRQRLSA